MTAPLPLVTPDNQHFWTGGARGELLILRCSSCSAWLHPPTPVCRFCLSTEVVPTAVSGRGRVLSYTTNHQPWMPDMEVPFVVVVVALDEDPGLRVFSRLVGDTTGVDIGSRVSVEFEQVSDVWLPLFRLEAA
jgi:uncharacterized OB-fold protein